MLKPRLNRGGVICLVRLRAERKGIIIRLLDCLRAKKTSSVMELVFVGVIFCFFWINQICATAKRSFLGALRVSSLVVNL